MLPPFIIDQIRRREEDVQRRQELDRPRLELPIDVYHPAPEPKPSEDDIEREPGREIQLLERRRFAVAGRITRVQEQHRKGREE